MKRGIDISSWQGKPDWGRVAQVVDFAILRITEKRGVDESFEHNYAGATSRKIAVGAYKLSYAKTKDEAIQEVDAVLQTIAGRPLDLPFFLDLEDEGGQQHLPQDTIYKITRAYEKAIKSAGYTFGIYCNLSWYRDIIPEKLKTRKFWIASYPKYDNGQVVKSLEPTRINNMYCWQYSAKGSVDGIAGPVDMDIFYKDFKVKGKGGEDMPKKELEAVKETPSNSIAPEGCTVEEILSIARGWIGRSEAAGTHRLIIDLYNSHLPRARGYAVQYSDSWCDACVSAMFIRAGAVDAIGGTECGVEEHIKLFKAAGIWIEDGTITPTPGDIVCYNWDTGSQPNDGFADHIGIVEDVEIGVFGVIEGNCDGAVKRRYVPVGWGYIRGFARPKYRASTDSTSADAGKTSPMPTTEELARCSMENGAMIRSDRCG